MARHYTSKQFREIHKALCVSGFELDKFETLGRTSTLTYRRGNNAVDIMRHDSMGCNYDISTDEDVLKELKDLLDLREKEVYV